MEKRENQAALLYGTHTYSIKEAEFIHTELAKKVHAGHVDVFPLDTAMALPNLRLSLIDGVQPKTYRFSRRDLI